jgi:hypothetical protein
MHRAMKSLWGLVSGSCIFLTTAPAFPGDPGPIFFNATDEVISIEITYDQGSGFRGDMGAGGLMEWPFAWQVQTIKVQLKDGAKLAVSGGQTVHLRGKLGKPGTQVWLIDGSRICVVDSRRFKPTKGFRCPGHR